MSTFADRTNRYADRFGLSRADRRRLLSHYPLFKLIHVGDYGAGWKRRGARRLGPLAGAWTLHHDAQGPGGTVRVPLRFTSDDIASFMEIFYERCYDVDVPPATTYVDAGANIGYAAAFFATQHPLERLLLIEANPDLMKSIGATIAGMPRHAEVENAALSPEEGTAAFTISENHRLSGVGHSQGRTVNVPARTLRGLLDRHGFEQVDILKMDIEGAEHAVLGHDPEILRRVGCLVGELHYSREERDVTAKLIADQGFEVKLDRGDEVDTVVAVRR